jgi:putative ABC transport system ATP-binding protein
MPLIELRRISKIFVTEEVETHVLSEVDLTIESGEYISIAGPSGCGKSTLLSILGMLDVPTGGEYLVDGKRLDTLSPGELARVRNQRIGFIFQSFNLIGDLTVAENVAIPLLYRGVPADARRAAVTEALERVEMSHRAKHYPSQLSGGQQQRVAVARAIVGKPSILLADEPTGNLDSKNGANVMDLIRHLHANGATVCMVTHDPRYAEHADRTVHLFDGRLMPQVHARLESVS